MTRKAATKIPKGRLEALAQERVAHPTGKVAKGVIAKAAGVAGSQVTLWTQGKTVPTGDGLLSLLRWLDTTVWNLFDLPAPPEDEIAHRLRQLGPTKRAETVQRFLGYLGDLTPPPSVVDDEQRRRAEELRVEVEKLAKEGAAVESPAAKPAPTGRHGRRPSPRPPASGR